MVVLLLTLTASQGVVARLSAAQEKPSAGPFELRPGVVIDPQRRLAYVMNPKGGIDAIGLARGELVWHSTQAAKPLAITGNLLVAQAETSRRVNELAVVTLDTRNGRGVVAGTLGLPVGTRVSVDDTAEGAFAIRARATAREALLWWEYSTFPLQGIRPGALEDADATGGTAARQADAAINRAASGRIRMDLSAGRLYSGTPGEIAAAPRHTPDAVAEERLSSVSGVQFVSADGRHVLTSRRVADDSVWNKYQWTIFDRVTGKRLGAIRNYRTQAPFVVLDSILTYETGPYVRRTDKGMINEPLKIHAVDIRSGVELWNRPLRDTVYRGPFPP